MANVRIGQSGRVRAFRRLASAVVLAACAGAAALPVRAGEPEFGGQCAMGLAEGKRIKTDCHINWQAPDGKTYCFGKEDSKSVFIKDPETNIRKAAEQFAMADSGTSSADDMGKFVAADVEAFIAGHIADAAAKNGGLFAVDDAMLGQMLALKFEKVEFVRTLHGYGFFPNTVERNV